MAKTYPIQQSFSAGEISPLLIARTDMPGYKHSTQKMLNMVPTVQGPVATRPGFEFIGQADDITEQYARMIPFHISFDESYVIIITVSTIYVADRDGFQLDTNLFLNSDFSAGSSDWTQLETGGANVSFPGGTCVLNPSVTEPAAIQQAIATTGANQHWVGFAGLDDNPCRIMVGTIAGDADILDQTFNSEDGGVFFTPGIDNFFVQYQAENNITKQLDTVAVVDTVTGEIFVKFPSPWNDPDVIETIQYAPAPGIGLLYLFQRDVAPQVVDYIGEHQWTFGPVVFTGSMPWGADSPGSVTFFKGRMYVGGSHGDSVGVWASKPGDYVNFELPVDVPVPTDAMYLPIDTEGDVQWLLGAKALSVGMDTGEHIILGEGGAIPTPANVDTQQQGAYGSARIQGQKIGEQIVFVTPDRRRLYMSTYSRDDLGWISDDVSYPSEHITAGLLREIDLMTTPYPILWFPTLDGKLVGMTYDARRKIIGWHRHDTQGFIVSSTVIRNRGRSELWVAVLRGPEGAETLHFEQTNSEFKMDSFKEKVLTTPGTIFSGFDHLEGLTVQVLADDAVHRDVVVGANGTPGTIELDYAATHVVAGLGYLSALRTLPIDMLTQDESKASFEKSWISIYVRLLEGSRPLVNGVRPPIRTAQTPMGQREPSKTEDVSISLVGWDLYGAIDIEQDLPLHTTIAGIFGEMEMETIEHG